MEYFSNVDSVYYPSVENKEREKNGNVLNVDNVYFSRTWKRVHKNWKCFPRSVKRLNGSWEISGKICELE